jgi:hypothetical protein
MFQTRDVAAFIPTEFRFLIEQFGSFYAKVNVVELAKKKHPTCKNMPTRPKKKAGVQVLAWKKHNHFKTSLDRLQFVQACLKQYTNDAIINNAIVIPVQRRTDRKNAYKRFFFTKTDLETTDLFNCTACSLEIEQKPCWIHNSHFADTLSPMCRKCFDCAF